MEGKKITVDEPTRQLLVEIVGMHIESTTDVQIAMAQDETLPDDAWPELNQDAEDQRTRLMALQEQLEGGETGDDTAT